MKFYTFSHAGGEELLKEKGLLREITDIFEELKRSQLHPDEPPRRAQNSSGHALIKSLFQNRGWEIEKYILQEKYWRWDVYRDKVAISIEFTGGTANIHRDLLRTLLLSYRNEIDVLVFITETDINKMVFANVKDEIKLFAPIINFPVYLIGLRNPPNW